jgi:hypothetical protein
MKAAQKADSLVDWRVCLKAVQWVVVLVGRLVAKKGDSKAALWDGLKVEMSDF